LRLTKGAHGDKADRITDVALWLYVLTANAMSLCARCRVDLQSREELSTGLNRIHLRSRISELDTLIAALTAERQSLQEASDSIIYPILSLPTEITIEVFRQCVQSTPKPRPSPSEAPLLLGQICRQWREIALDAHDLWQCLQFPGDTAPAELLELWLSRSGNLPLNYSLSCSDPSRAGAMIETMMPHSCQWQEVSFSSLPRESLSMLDLRRQSWPVLRMISFDTYNNSSNELVQDTIVIQNAPLLREVQIPRIPKLIFDLPWRQLSALTLRRAVDLAECMALLRQCRDLVLLVVTTTFTDSSSLHTDLTMEHLESLTCNLADTPILNHLTLPHLRRLIVTGPVSPSDPTHLESFVRRSRCILDFHSLPLNFIAPNTLPSWLKSLPNSVTSLEFTWRPTRELPPGLVRVLHSADILPRLKSLRFSGGRLSQAGYDDMIDLLCARRESSVALDSLTMNLRLHSSVNTTPYMPKASTVARLREFIADGMTIDLAISGRSNFQTYSLIAPLASRQELI
jgi:hypothetical protein